MLPSNSVCLFWYGELLQETSFSFNYFRTTCGWWNSMCLKLNGNPIWSLSHRGKKKLRKTVCILDLGCWRAREWLIVEAVGLIQLLCIQGTQKDTHAHDEACAYRISEKTACTYRISEKTAFSHLTRLWFQSKQEMDAKDGTAKHGGCLTQGWLRRLQCIPHFFVSFSL